MGVGNVLVFRCCIITPGCSGFSLLVLRATGLMWAVLLHEKLARAAIIWSLSRLSCPTWPVYTSGPLAETAGSWGQLGLWNDWASLCLHVSSGFPVFVVSLHDMSTCQISYLMIAQCFPKDKIRSCQAFLWLRLRMGTASFPLVNMSHRPSSDSMWTTKGMVCRGPSWKTSYHRIGMPGRSEGDKV